MPVIADVVFCTDLSHAGVTPDLLVIGRKEALRAAAGVAALQLPEATWQAMLDRVEPGDSGTTMSGFVGARRIMAGVLPEVCSRHNPPSRALFIPELVRRLDGKAEATVVLALSDPRHALASVLAAARAFSQFNASSGNVERRVVSIVALGPDGPVKDERIPVALAATRYAARLTDTPTSTMHADALVHEARAVAERLGVGLRIIQGHALDRLGFGGLWGVGKAATHLPALVALVHEPPGATRTVAWVGKGIVYDTGGLSLKDRTSMVGMKGDMAGAATVLAAFEAAVRIGVPYRLVAVLCVAENSVGPDATRPDDILTLRSGKTVEVNNTDAEGRLVLADGLHWVSTTFQPDLAVDLATLTGAALVATGKNHAAIYANREDIERAIVAAGLTAGEPVHPMLYAPELHRREFRSAVADMKNSVKDRMNAQSSCAAQFIANHLPDPPPPWVHVDMAGTSSDGEGRGTGYGVGLLLSLGDAQG